VAKKKALWGGERAGMLLLARRPKRTDFFTGRSSRDPKHEARIGGVKKEGLPTNESPQKSIKIGAREIPHHGRKENRP